jgi:CcmD family protein
MSRWNRVARVGLAIAMSWVLMAPAVLAQEPGQKQFVPLESVQRQELAPGPLLYTAYAFVWAALVFYIFIVWRRLSRVERELADVNRKLAAK